MKRRQSIKMTFIGVLTLLGAHTASAQEKASGRWFKKTYSAAGSWSISESEGKLTLSLKGLKTKSGPNLKIFFSPLSVESVKGNNATKGSLKIANLKSNKGDQTYVLPAGTDLSKYKSVIIHCEKFSKLWSAGKL